MWEKDKSGFILSVLVLAGLTMILDGCAPYQRNAQPLRDDIGKSLMDTRYNLSFCRYEQAIDVISVALSRYPGHAGVADEYSETMEKIRVEAEKMIAKKEHGRAGELFAKMRRDLKKHIRAARNLSFDDTYLARRIAFCSSKLTEEGLVRYREGEIEGAIALWEHVLDFDPENQEVQNAIETATLQMKNLQEID